MWDTKYTLVQKQCKKHGATDHALVYEKSTGYSRWRCKACNVEAVSKRRRKTKQLAIDYLGGKCMICGYSRCASALEFHHKNPEEKDFAISESGQTYGWDKVKSEIDKCVLLCANCHREVHSGLASLPTESAEV